MSILIKGMEIPKICAGAMLIIYEGKDGMAMSKIYKLSATDLIEVPSHGRLIDADKAVKAIEDLQDCYNGFSDTYNKACIIGVIQELPTIIDAESEDKK